MIDNEGQQKAGEMGQGVEAYADLAVTLVDTAKDGDSPYVAETSSGRAEVTARQETTRGDGTLELSGDKFSREKVDFTGVREHLRIHQGGEVAGSQFDGEVFPDAQAVESFITQALPEGIQFDQFGRVEMTLTVELPNHETIGYSGVKSVTELQADGVQVEKGMRTPGGEPGEVDGLQGAWYPEMTRDAETGAFVVARTESGDVKNSHGKFEPEASIATVTDSEEAKTNKLSVVMQKDPETGRAVVLTAYPGEISPPFPAKITTEAFSADSLEGNAADYWRDHAFIKFAPKP